MAGIAAAQPDVHVRVLCLRGDKAERWTNYMEEGDFLVTSYNVGHVTTLNKKPSLVTKDPAVAMDGVDIVAIVLPAFAHELYLKAIAPHIQPGLVLVGLPGMAGFEFAAKEILADKFQQVTLMSFASLPWVCRTTEYGRSVDVIATKDVLPGCCLQDTRPLVEEATHMLQKCLGPLPKLEVSGNVLAITLMSINGYLHPAILYGRWNDWDGCPLTQPPLFYHGIDRKSADCLAAISEEVLEIARVTMKQRPDVDLHRVHSMQEWYLRCFVKNVTDKTDLYSCIQTNQAYTGLAHPMEKTADGRYVPNFQHRYMTEDIPFGLVVMRGIATIAGVATPNIDRVIRWAEKVSGKEYLSGDHVSGRDLLDSRAPQCYDLRTLDAILDFGK